MQFLAVVAHTCNPGTQEAEPGKSFEFEASLVSRVPESQGSTEKPCLEKDKNKNKKKNKQAHSSFHRLGGFFGLSVCTENVFIQLLIHALKTLIVR